MRRVPWSVIAAALALTLVPLPSAGPDALGFLTQRAGLAPGIVSLVSALSSLLLLAPLFRKLGFDARGSAAGLLLLAGALPMPSAGLGLTGALALALFAVTRRWRIVVAVFAAAVLEQSSLIALLPFVLWLLWTRERDDLRAAYQLSIPIVLVPLWGVVLAGKLGAPEPWIWPPDLSRVHLLELGLLPVLPLIDPRGTWRYLRESREWAIWVVSAAAIALVGSAGTRVLDASLPPLIVLGLMAALRVGERIGRGGGHAWLAITVAAHAWIARGLPFASGVFGCWGALTLALWLRSRMTSKDRRA